MPTLNLADPRLDEVTDVWDASQPNETLVLEFAAGRSGLNSSPATVILGSDSDGAFVRGDGETTLCGWMMNDNSNNILGTDRATVFFLRKCRDTVNRGYITVGYDGGASIRFFASLAEGGSNEGIFDAGNATEGSGRVLFPYTKNTALETIVLLFEAFEGGRGREVWRNGVKIADGPGGATREPDSNPFCIGPCNSTTPMDDVQYYHVGIVDRCWTQAEIEAYAANPKGIYLAEGGGSDLTPAAGVATVSGSASARAAAAATAAAGVASVSVTTGAMGSIDLSGTLARFETLAEVVHASKAVTFWLHDATTGALLATIPTTTDSNGRVGVLQNVAIAPGVMYRLDFKFGTGEFGVIWPTSES